MICIWYILNHLFHLLYHIMYFITNVKRRLHIVDFICKKFFLVLLKRIFTLEWVHWSITAWNDRRKKVRKPVINISKTLLRYMCTSNRHVIFFPLLYDFFPKNFLFFISFFVQRKFRSSEHLHQTYVYDLLGFSMIFCFPRHLICNYSMNT